MNRAAQGDEPRTVAGTFEHRSRMPAPAAEVFAWHLRPGAFERLLPPADHTHILAAEGSIEDDTRTVTLSVPLIGPVRQRWEIRHEGFVPGARFRDRMMRGPFRSWVHEHRVEPDGDSDCWLVDHVEYELPFGVLGRLVGGPLVRRRLARTFDHRHQLMADDLRAHAEAALSPGTLVAVQGAHQPAGRQIVAYLTTGGIQVVTDAAPVEAALVVVLADRVVLRRNALAPDTEGYPQRTLRLTGSGVEDPRAVERALAHMLRT